MQLNTISEEQSQAIKMMKDNQLSLLLYLDPNMLASTLLHACVNGLLEGKRSLLIIEDDRIFSSLIEKLKRLGLGPYSVALKESDFLTDSEISKIRTLYKQKESPSLRNYRIHHKISELLKDRIESAFESMGARIFGERKWVDLCRSKSNFIRPLNEYQQQINLKFTPQEFWHILGKIEEGQKLYDEKNVLSDNILEKFKISLDSPDSLDILRTKLDQFRYKLSNLISKLDNEIQRYEDKIWTKLKEEQIQLKDICQKISIRLLRENNQKNNNGFTFFPVQNKKKETDKFDVSEFFPVLKSNILFGHDHLLQKDFGAEEIQNLINSVQEQIHGWQKIGEGIVFKMIKSLNKHNSDSNTLLNIDQEINVLFREMNESDIFSESFENTSMNIVNQFVFLSDLLKSIKILQDYIKTNKELILWQSFYHQLSPETKAIIDLLKMYDRTQWAEIFEAWYFGKLIHVKSNPDILVMDRLLEELKEENENILKELPSIIEHKLGTKRAKSTALFRTKNKKLYNQLFKKKGVDNLRFFDFIWEEKEMITHYMPIAVVSEKIFRSNRLLKDGNWDYVFCNNTNIFAHIEKFTFLERHICFFSPLSEGIKTSNDIGISLEDEKKCSKVLLHEYNYNQILKELPISDRLKGAKKLAKLILALNQNLKIYQLKYANILSLFSIDYNDLLVRTLDSFGLKETDIESKLYEAVTESILETDRKQYLLIQDFAINLDAPAHFQWQRYVLDLFSQAGFEIINVSSTENARIEMHFDEIKNTIIPTIEEEPSMLLSNQA